LAAPFSAGDFNWGLPLDICSRYVWSLLNSNNPRLGEKSSCDSRKNHSLDDVWIERLGLKQGNPHFLDNV
jgi:hypothetical protein